MNDVLFLFLSLSISGSILALVLLAIKPLIKNRLSQTWQYYVWLIVILRFLLPFTPQVSVVGELSQNIQNIANLPATLEAENVSGIDMNEEYTIPQVPNISPISQTPQDTEGEAPEQPAYWREILNNIWLLWIVAALVLFMHKVASYRSFVRFIKVGMEKITDEHIMDIYRTELAAAKIKRQLPLYINNQVVSPMLVGIVRPALVIPQLEASDGELRNIIRHELTHYKRLDFLYKWIVQINLCLHWFNPLVYLISKQIEKSCELSCDESVIKHLDEDGRIIYGDAIMASLKAQGNYSNFVVSLTMSENVNIVKERLDIIMSYKKKSSFVFGITILLTATLLCGFTVVGAYASDTNNKSIPITQTIADPSKTNLDTLPKSAVSIITEIDSIPAGQVICVGEITLDSSLPLVYNVTAKSGEKFFVALGETDSVTSVTASRWWNVVRNDTDDLTVWETIQNSLAKGTFYLYIGNEGKTTLTDISILVYQLNDSDKDYTLQYTMDATTILRLNEYEVTASDKNMMKTIVAQDVQQWLSTCDRVIGAYLLQKNTATGYTYYLYYNGGGRYPWGIGVDGTSIAINLLNVAVTGDGYHLMKIDTPIEQAFSVKLDGASLPIITHKDK